MTAKKNAITTKKQAAKKKDNPAGQKAPFPKDISPMLATLIDEPFDEPGWIYEVKWDGYRAIAYLNKGKVHLSSRNNKSFDEKFYPVYDALAALGIDAVLDGEVIVANDAGISNFGNLQNWRSEADGNLQFYVFDILWLNGYSLLSLPLSERREILLDTISDTDTIHVSKAFSSTGTEFFEAAKQMKLEGIMAKKESSLYTPGDRTRDWLKIKVSKRHEVVIGASPKTKALPNHSALCWWAFLIRENCNTPVKLVPAFPISYKGK